jgi:hypothetical protein
MDTIEASVISCHLKSPETSSKVSKLKQELACFNAAKALKERLFVACRTSLENPEYHDVLSRTNDENRKKAQALRAKSKD